MNNEFGRDSYLLYLTNKGLGRYSTTIERTPVGQHLDHVDSFYSHLKPEQQAAMVGALDDPEQVANFEAGLTSGQLETWQDLKAEAKELQISYKPEKALEGTELALADLRTMLDKGLSDDPETRALQEQTIESLGGQAAVYDLIQESLQPAFDPNGMAPLTKELLEQVVDNRFTFTLRVDENGQETWQPAFEDEVAYSEAGHDGGTDFVIYENEQRSMWQILNEFIEGGYEKVGQLGGSAVPSALEKQGPAPAPPSAEISPPVINMTPGNP